MKKKYGIIFVFILALGLVLVVIVKRSGRQTFFVANSPIGTGTAVELTSDFLETDANAGDLASVADEDSKTPAVSAPTPSSSESQKAQPKPAAPGSKTKSLAKGFEGSVRNRIVDFGFSVPKNPRFIDTIILHSSYDAVGNDPYSVSGVIDIWKSYDVAPHYLIDRDGAVYRLVKDENIAYHAGVSRVPDGRTNVNDFSVGIEIINTLDGKYTDEQYSSVKGLIVALKGKYAIKYVLGHDDIAPGRKTDPWNFDWKRLDGSN